MDNYLLPLVWQMEDIIAKEGTDYRSYSPNSKKVIMVVASNVGSVKVVLEILILTEAGSLTEESAAITEKIGQLLYKR